MTGPVRRNEIENLAPMPASVIRLAQMLDDYASNVNEIARVIELDPALTANVLRVANSAWSGSINPIVTVRSAVIRLGLARILWFAVGRHVAAPMTVAQPGYQLCEGELWRHSVAAALAAEQLSKLAPAAIPGVAFTAALLHDIGKLLLSRHLDEDTVERIRRAAGERGSYVQAEREMVGTDHAEVGGAIALHWQFPRSLVAAIARHHDSDGEPDVLGDTIHLSNVVAKLIGVGMGSEEMNLAVNPAAPQRLGLSAGGLEQVCAKVTDELARAEKNCGSDSHGLERAASR